MTKNKSKIGTGNLVPQSPDDTESQEKELNDVNIQITIPISIPHPEDSNNGFFSPNSIYSKDSSSTPSRLTLPLHLRFFRLKSFTRA